MSDNSSPSIFALIFDELAINPTEEHKKIAEKIWKKHKEYDFCSVDMFCDESLIKLDLAKKGPNPDYPEDSDYEETVLYKGQDY